MKGGEYTRWPFKAYSNFMGDPMSYTDSLKPEVLFSTFNFHTENKSWRVLEHCGSNPRPTQYPKFFVQLHISIYISVLSVKNLD